MKEISKEELATVLEAVGEGAGREAAPGHRGTRPGGNAMNDIEIPWGWGAMPPSHTVTWAVGGVGGRESYGVPEAYLRAAGWVPASERLPTFRKVQRERDAWRTVACHGATGDTLALLEALFQQACPPAHPRCRCVLVADFG